MAIGSENGTPGSTCIWRRPIQRTTITDSTARWTISEALWIGGCTALRAATLRQEPTHSSSRSRLGTTGTGTAMLLKASLGSNVRLPLRSILLQNYMQQHFDASGSSLRQRATSRVLGSCSKMLLIVSARRAPGTARPQ